MKEHLMELSCSCERFVRSMRGERIDGFYRYSFSGDLFGENAHWGLGNTVFAAKSLYMIGRLTAGDCRKMAHFIRSFQTLSGYICDPIVEKESRSKRLIAAVRTLDSSNIFNTQTKRAETRQAFAALRCLGEKPSAPVKDLPANPEAIGKYVHALNWRNPWGAASHVSHLVFYLRNNQIFFGANQCDTDKLIKAAFKESDTYRRKDGSWYLKGIDLPISHKVNAAMKMMTAYSAAESVEFDSPEKLIDLCLSSASLGDACNNFNTICVLHSCVSKTNYRFDEVCQYCVERLKIYRRHYWPAFGGFSFREGFSNTSYYGANIARGYAEPDIHGTVLFLWGISLISKILKVECGLKIPVT